MSNLNTVTVILKSKHTHDGVKYDKGSSLEVSTPDASWLIGQGIAEVQHPEAEAKKK